MWLTMDYSWLFPFMQRLSHNGAVKHRAGHDFSLSMHKHVLYVNYYQNMTSFI
uniref:Uncharacterized protein n=1 Tax=Anguilla anguilla TaxID=7936 RepID=A0A0E9UHA9_ANGAN